MTHSTTIAILIVLIFASIAAVFTKLFHERQRGLFTFGQLTFPFGRSAQWIACFAAMIIAFNIIRPDESRPNHNSGPPTQQQSPTAGSAPNTKPAKVKKAVRRKVKLTSRCKIP